MHSNWWELKNRVYLTVLFESSFNRFMQLIMEKEEENLTFSGFNLCVSLIASLLFRYSDRNISHPHRWRLQNYVKLKTIMWCVLFSKVVFISILPCIYGGEWPNALTFHVPQYQLSGYLLNSSLINRKIIVWSTEATFPLDPLKTV